MPFYVITDPTSGNANGELWLATGTAPGALPADDPARNYTGVSAAKYTEIQQTVADLQADVRDPTQALRVNPATLVLFTEPDTRPVIEIVVETPAVLSVTVAGVVIRGQPFTLKFRNISDPASNAQFEYDAFERKWAVNFNNGEDATRTNVTFDLSGDFTAISSPELKLQNSPVVLKVVE